MFCVWSIHGRQYYWRSTDMSQYVTLCALTNGARWSERVNKSSPSLYSLSFFPCLDTSNTRKYFTIMIIILLCSVVRAEFRIFGTPSTSEINCTEFAADDPKGLRDIWESRRNLRPREKCEPMEQTISPLPEMCRSYLFCYVVTNTDYHHRYYKHGVMSPK